MLMMMMDDRDEICFSAEQNTQELWCCAVRWARAVQVVMRLSYLISYYKGIYVRFRYFQEDAWCLCLFKLP